MEFELGEDQKLMQEAAREFAEKKLMPIAEKMDEDEAVPAEIYKELGGLGYFGMLLPEKYGGLDLDTLSYVCAMEELARGSAGVMIGLSVHNSLCCRAVYDWGSDHLKDKYLPGMASGELFGSYCLSEPGAGTDAGSLQCTADEKGDKFVLNGIKSWITSAGVATAEDIDTVMKLGMNHPMGPLSLADFIGLDVCLDIMEVLHEGYSDSKYRPCPLLKKMVQAEYLGRKSGRGFYVYEK